MNRREFIVFCGSTALSWPHAARAQQHLPIVGFLGAQNPELFASRLRAFRQGLGETGYVEGSNVAIEFRWAQGHDDQLTALASDLVQRQVAVIAASSTSSAIAAKAETKTIPIVVVVSSDPVKLGLIDSLGRPGGNITGSTNLGVEAGSKRLELLHELLPAATTIALLAHPANPGVEGQINEHQAAARALGLQLQILRANSEQEIETAFASCANLGVKAVAIGPDNFFSTHSQQIAAAALRYRIPAVYNDRPFPAAGGLMSYGASITDQYRISGIYVGRILKGERPSDLPFQQSAKVELVINMKTAKVFDLTIPPSILERADEAIE